MVIHCATCITRCSHRRNHVKTDRKGYKKDVAFELSIEGWQRAPINGMERESSAERRNSANQVPGPHTGVNCVYSIHWVFGQILLCAFCVPKLGGGDANGNQKWSCMKGLIVKSTQDCKRESHLYSGWRSGSRKGSPLALGKNISHEKTQEEHEGKISIRGNFQVSKV